MGYVTMLNNLSKTEFKKTPYPNLIYDQIIQSIMNGSLSPGDILPSENDFIAQFGVGRTSVREALASLEYLNVIVNNNGKYYVNENVQSYFKKKLLYHYKLDRKRQDDLFVVRKILEKNFAILAAQRATENDCKYMQKILSHIKDCLDSLSDSQPVSETDYSELMDQFVQFHSSIAHATQNSLLCRIFDRFKDLMFYNSYDAPYQKEQLASLLLAAQQIAKAIHAHDADCAQKTTREYLNILSRE